MAEVEPDLDGLVRGRGDELGAVRAEGHGIDGACTDLRVDYEQLTPFSARRAIVHLPTCMRVGELRARKLASLAVIEHDL